MAKIDKQYLENLYAAILSLEDKEQCAAFFDDIFTIQELESISQRLEVARLLHEGKNYLDINKLTGASTATICRVSKCLSYGTGGYASVISKMEGADD
jgi:TrpR-related protein YerC/YecD